MRTLCPLLLVALIAAVPAFAATAPVPAPDPAAKLAEYRKFADSLHYQKGSVTLRDGLAKINLPDSFRYLSPADSTTLLTKLWGNPAGPDTLGAIVPAGFDPLARGSWAVFVTYDEDGYVKDDDAAKIKYDELLQQMKDGTQEASKQRAEAGYPTIELVGWAAPPRYDPAAHKLYWAKDIKFGDSPTHTLNYNIRMLGRRGVLVLNAVAGMPDLKAVEAATPTILSMVDFQDGHRYADFNGDTDKTATYGIAALVAGGIAAKAGFFKVLWLGILAFKKLLIVAVIALAVYAKKTWAWIRGRETRTATATGPTDPPATTPSSLSDLD